ncbi:hypothetical protein SASPL_125240 [Salvia splendens]|uniref:Glycoside hydrolase family 13 N-terminal domain-containing protein n=1 Tax=Salvia splendens TaxID=180675 RepID=A0A8X8XDF6_SALSN|nr:hypothetical protein SASPL_125240 [Salvia splendens]
MAMLLPVRYVMRSHGLSSEASESSKLFSCSCKRDQIFNKLVSNPKIECVKRIERIHCDRSKLKALATSDVYVAKASEKLATYRFRTEFGGRLKMPLDFQQSSVDGQCETRFVGGAVKLDFEADLAPVYLSFLLKSDSGSDSKVSMIRSHRNTKFTVPVGFGAGNPSPLGVSFLSDGSVNFAFFSCNVESVVLCLYSNATAEKPALEIDLDLYINRSGDIWHALLYSSAPFVSYGYRCRNGGDNKEHHVLLDPYAKVIEGFGLNQPLKWLGKLCEEPAFDWSDEVCPNLPMEKMIVYRLNVARFTKDKSSKLSGGIAGSFSAISEKSQHFEDLGINAILPSGDPLNVAKSMKEIVKKLHSRGIEVLLEVVFTHSGDVGALQEIDSSTNALNCNHPTVQQLVLESLTGSQGEFLSRPPLVEAIAFDPVLAGIKIVADSWVPHGMATKVVGFPHWQRWAEMNSKFSIDVKNFLRGGRGLISEFATLELNCGEEGATNKKVVLETRLKQIRNLLFTLFISLGVPVLNMGDECGQSTGGSPSAADRETSGLERVEVKLWRSDQSVHLVSGLAEDEARRSSTEEELSRGKQYRMARKAAVTAEMG